MFGILIIFGALIVAAGLFGVYFTATSWKHKAVCAFAICVGVAIPVLSFKTTRGQLVLRQLAVCGKAGNWLVVDRSNSGVVVHWVLKNSYVDSYQNGSGWEFFDKAGNGPIYVSQSTLVVRINQPLDEFLKSYKLKYNIPESQKALEQLRLCQVATNNSFS